MPQLQVINTAERPPDPTGVEQLFSNINKSYQDESDRVKIGQYVDRYKQARDKDENAFENLQLDLESSDLPPTKRLQLQQNINEIERLKIARDKSNKSSSAEMSKQQSKAKAKELIKRQREILETGHLGSKIAGFGKTGRKAKSTFSKEGNALRSEYVRIGKALIQQASTLVIRNKPEFEVLAHDLYDPTLSQEEIKGTLDALERIVDDETSDESSKKSSPTERPSLTSFQGK